MTLDFTGVLADAALRSDIPTAPTAGGGPCLACRTGRHGECTGVSCWHCPPSNHRRDGWPHIVTDIGDHQ